MTAGTTFCDGIEHERARPERPWATPAVIQQSCSFQMRVGSGASAPSPEASPRRPALQSGQGVLAETVATAGSMAVSHARPGLRHTTLPMERA